MGPDLETKTVQCVVCGTPLDPSEPSCPACEYGRPPGGWPELDSAEDDSLFEVDANPVAPVALQLPRSLPPASDGRIELGAPPDLPLAFEEDQPDEELLEFGEDSDPVGFALPEDHDSLDVPHPKALRVRVVPKTGGQVDEPDVVVPLQAQVAPVRAPSDPVTLEPGAAFASRYRVDELLEEHGSCRNYLAVQEPMVRRVQLTVLGDLGGGESQQETEARFLREGAQLARHSHPNLAAVVDYGRAPDGRCYVATELVYGFSMRELMERGPVAPERLAPMLLDIARGLAACHDADVVHRGLWPEKVILETTPGAGASMARIAGTGLGLVAQALADPPSPAIAGSLAPEVVQGQSFSAASDVYAFGSLAAAALLGRPVFVGSPEAVLRAHVEQPPDGLDALVRAGGLAGSLADMALRCLDKDPSARFDSAAALVPLLEGLVGASARAALAPAGLGWRVLLAAALAGALMPTLLLAAVGLWVLNQPEPPPPAEPAASRAELRDVVEAQAAAEVRDEVAALQAQLGALEEALQDAVAMAEEAREEAEEAEPPAPPVRPRPRPAPAVAPPPAPVVTEPEPEPEPVVAEPEPEPEPVVAEPEPEPEPEPPPPPPPHPAAAAVDGMWLGTVSGRDLALNLVVTPDGSVGGSARLRRGAEVESASVRGRVAAVDGGYQLELQVVSEGEITSYSGLLQDGVIQGRIAQGGRSRGRWRVAR